MIVVNTGGEGWPVVIGAVIGGLASLGGTILTLWWRERPKKELDRTRQQILRKRFAASNSEWIPYEKLAEAVGTDRQSTIRLLLMIGARRSMGERDVWGLKDWPEPSN